MKLKTFFSYYGSKHSMALHYPKPRYRHIIEPFAGSAGYALHFASYDVTLYDTNKKVCGVWDYLTKVSREEILRLPLEVDHVFELHEFCQEARWFIGYSIGAANLDTRMRPGTLAQPCWNERKRLAVANQVDKIRHWKIVHGHYDEAPDVEATWFVDPPYQNACGKIYKHKFDDYGALGEWCENRRGQVIVCEQSGADWLPFVPFGTTKSTLNNESEEVIWCSDWR